ncbi:MAG: CGGC domain-containing protein [Planctomycetes bacterium GWF2_50_10]|nr:MAG: CGGC domain-containing protein [Planctomycetes bacterium GWF2_50_10]
MLKVGFIRCQQTEDLCPGTMDLIIAREGKGVFEECGPVEVVGFVSCGGCPGKRVIARAKMLVERGADAIAFASCIAKGTPIGFPCPHWNQMREAVIKKLDSRVRLFDWSH